MSTKTPDEINSLGLSSDSDASTENSPADDAQQWAELCEEIAARQQKSPAKKVLGDVAAAGQVYRWGIAAASGSAPRPLDIALSRLACDSDRNVALKGTKDLDLAAAAELFADECGAGPYSLFDATAAVRWAAALPALRDQLSPADWWSLLGTLQQMRELTLQSHEPDSPVYLTLVGELGLTLAWRLDALPSCKRLQTSSIEAVKNWIDGEDDSVAAAVNPPACIRLVAAALWRSQQILESTSRSKLGKKQLAFAAEFGTWVAGLSTHKTTTVFSDAKRADVVDDCGKLGLLSQMTSWDAESLRPALAAATGASQTGGRLAWEVCLPEAILHSDEGQVAVLMPEWDVRRGRTFLDYSGEDVRIEMYAGKSIVLKGNWQVFIDLDDEQQHAIGPWSYTCEYTDDEVHYIEIEQLWSGGIVLQRQVGVVRDDRTVLVADSVIPRQPQSPGDDDDSTVAQSNIRYTSRLPMDSGIKIDGETETREVFFASEKKRLGLVFPLAASEWQVGPTAAKLASSEDGHLVYTVNGSGRLYAPLWFDFQARRFRRKRTWRKLTVAENLKIVGDDAAVGYRVQVGSEQWMMYRSLGESCVRTVLGKHLIADFFCGRFDPGDGSIDELLTVDDKSSDE